MREAGQRGACQHDDIGAVPGNGLQRQVDQQVFQPENLYGFSKLAAEQAVARLSSVLGMTITVGRLGTCFGPWEHGNSSRDTPSAVLQIIKKYKSGEKVVLPRPHRRDWLYARDAAGAIISLTDDPSPKHAIYDLAAGFKWSLEDLCRELSARAPSFAWELGSVDTGNIDLYGTRDRAAMSTQRLAETDFDPRYGLKAAVADYLEWWDAAGLSADGLGSCLAAEGERRG